MQLTNSLLHLSPVLFSVALLCLAVCECECVRMCFLGCRQVLGLITRRSWDNGAEIRAEAVTEAGAEQCSSNGCGPVNSEWTLLFLLSTEKLPSCPALSPDRKEQQQHLLPVGRSLSGQSCRECVHSELSATCNMHSHTHVHSKY